MPRLRFRLQLRCTEACGRFTLAYSLPLFAALLKLQLEAGGCNALFDMLMNWSLPVVCFLQMYVKLL